MTMRKKRKFKSIISTFLCLALLGGAVFGVTKLLKNDSDTVEIKNSAFAVGGLDEEGKYVENKQTLYTKEEFECQGLKVNLAFDFTGSYQIFFYDYFGNFLSSSDVLSSDFDDDLPINTRYARIMIIPEIPEDVETEDFKINFVDKHSILSDVTIIVDKVQKFPSYAYESRKGIEYYVNEAGSLMERENEDFSSAVLDVDFDYFVINNSTEYPITVFMQTRDGTDTIVVAPGDFYDTAKGTLNSVVNICFSYLTSDVPPTVIVQ